MPTPDFFLAFIAGLVSFLSPCVLPLVPAYIGYLSGSALQVARGNTVAAARPVVRSSMGTTAAATTAASTTATATATMTAPQPRPAPTISTAAARWTVMLHALLFVAGLTFVFVVVIGGLAGALSDFLQRNKREVQYVMGGVLIIFGLHMMGAINIPFLNYTRRLDIRPSQKVGYVRSLLIGMAFGIGWTPCIGPVLSSIFFLAANRGEWEAFPLFLAYSLGLGVPFLITAMATGQIAGWLKKITRRSFTFKIGGFTVLRQVNAVSLVSGVLLIFMGVLIATNSLGLIAPQVNWIEGI